MARRPLGALLVVLALAGCGSGDAKTPSASIERAPTSAPTTTTAPMAPEQEVEAAYLKAWDAYAKAVRNLDPTGLEEAYTGDALATVRREVERLASSATAIVVAIEHDLHVQIVDPHTALVRDRYVNRNYRVDRSGSPLDNTDDPGTYVDTYQLARGGDGRWRVGRIVRESRQS